MSDFDTNWSGGVERWYQIKWRVCFKEQLHYRNRKCRDMLSYIILISTVLQLLTHSEF